RAYPLQFGKNAIQAHPLDVLHDVIVNVLVLADAVYRDDVGVVQARCRLGLALKALLMSGIEEGADRQNLEGDAPSERLLLGLIDDPHAAAADLAQNAIIADPIQASRLGHDQGDGGSYRLVEYITLEILQSDD